LSLVVRNEGKDERTFKAVALAYESLETRLSSILFKKISFELSGNIYCILSLHLQKMRFAIKSRSLLVD